MINIKTKNKPCLKGICFITLAEITKVTLVSSSDSSYLKINFTAGVNKGVGLLFEPERSLLALYDRIRETVLGERVFVSGYVNKNQYLSILAIEGLPGPQITFKELHKLRELTPFLEISALMEIGVRDNAKKKP